MQGIELSPAMLERLHAKPEAATVTTTQDGQVDVLANAAAHLRPGGHFVVEVGVPQLQQVPPGQRFHVFTRTQEGRRSSLPFRYAWPAELDLMARLAGMRLVHRWDGWDRSPFRASSTSHVSVWRRED